MERMRGKKDNRDEIAVVFGLFDSLDESRMLRP